MSDALEIAKAALQTIRRDWTINRKKAACDPGTVASRALADIEKAEHPDAPEPRAAECPHYCVECADGPCYSPNDERRLRCDGCKAPLLAPKPKCGTCEGRGAVCRYGCKNPACDDANVCPDCDPYGCKAKRAKEPR
jgi:hypothetical protein